MGESESEKEDWVVAAMGDDALAALMLVRLSRVPPRRQSSARLSELRWGQTQPRSRQVGRVASHEPKKEVEADEDGEERAGRRGSPTTPLSWSDGTSPSGGDGCEASTSRSAKRKSKASVSLANASTNGSRRSKKKKTMDELKAEENELLRLNMELKQKLKAVKIKHKELRDKNDSLKLMLKQQSEDQVENEPKPAVTKPLSECFSLPDLNLPIEEESVSETLYGMS